jgi:hypothetical protein
VPKRPFEQAFEYRNVVGEVLLELGTERRWHRRIASRRGVEAADDGHGLEPGGVKRRILRRS